MTAALPVRRVIVFVDYQNVYEDFRRAFCSGTLLPTNGQFYPDLFGQLLASRGPDFEEWRIDDVRVYLGRPSPDRNPKGAGAHDRQTQAWRDAGITVRARALQYLPNQRPRQKGVDVELAVDVVRLAVEKQYEIGIIASTDTDLLPAIEAVDRLRGEDAVPRVCGVAYSGLPKQLQRSEPEARQPWIFRLRRVDFDAIRDNTVYVSPEDGPVTAEQVANSN